MRDMGPGMLVVETIAKIRRAYFVQQKPIKAICRELGLSRKVVRKVLRSEATEFRYTRARQPLPKIGPWRDEIDALLLGNEGKAPRERPTSRRGRWSVMGRCRHQARRPIDRRQDPPSHRQLFQHGRLSLEVASHQLQCKI